MSIISRLATNTYKQEYSTCCPITHKLVSRSNGLRIRVSSYVVGRDRGLGIFIEHLQKIWNFRLGGLSNNEP